MKILKSLSFAVLMLSLVTAVAFRPATNGKKFVGTAYKLTPGTNAHTPGNYTVYTGTIPPNSLTCPTGTSQACVIVTDQIYSHTDPTNPDLPKVDAPTGSGTIHDWIDAVLLTPSKAGTVDPSDPNGVSKVFLRS
jgi:hypothetical protein